MSQKTRHSNKSFFCVSLSFAAGLIKLFVFLAAARIAVAMTYDSKGIRMYDIFLGSIVDDVIVGSLAGESLASDKVNAAIEHRLGGGAAHSALEFQRSGDSEPMLLAITGADELGSQLMTEVRGQFPLSRRLDSANRTRSSIITPTEKTGRTRTFSVRSKLDHAATFDVAAPLLPGCRCLFIASMMSRDADLVERLIETHQGETYMIPTASQITDRERTVGLMQKATFTQMNRYEFELLTESDADLERGFDVFRRADVGSVIVTDGENGIHAFHEGTLYHVPAFDVEVVCDSSAGDTVAGAILAGLAHGLAFKEVLENAAAAAAIQIAAIPRTSGYGQLCAFGKSARRHFQPRPTERIGRYSVRAKRLIKSTAVAATVIVAITMSGMLLFGG